MIRIGYACMNASIECTSASTFRLASWSEKRFKETVTQNLDCLEKILQWNIRHSIYFFRITSDLIPFASHPICFVDWQSISSEEFARIGDFARANGTRVSMYPGQYTVLNSNRNDVSGRSILELEYHTNVLNLMNQCPDAKMVVHLGGVYGDRENAMRRFAEIYQGLANSTKNPLVIENDERIYIVTDCISIHDETGIPGVLDILHHEANNDGESILIAFKMVRRNWTSSDGPPIVHYSTQEPGGRPGKHALSIDSQHSQTFLVSFRRYDFDVMLEVKDEERSAIEGIRVREMIESHNEA